MMDRWSLVERAAYWKMKNSRRGLRHRGPFRLVDRVGGSPRSLDPKNDGQDAPQVPIQLAAAAVVVGPCSRLHLRQDAAAADAGRSSLAPIRGPQ